ncbi:uncharacterized protein LOC118751314 [Rhagoletis pomonella]|uniref:uncharacterized protein LOC118751314 n=1 Tax=Rhagoletis pomonella TaxID=28610 RepID=UPI00177DC59A|nr:uncharacterized protein LOC118751314 [Rhagoletis pomonella]
MELNAFETDLLDSNSCFSLAETQGTFSMDAFIDGVDVSKGNFVCMGEGKNENTGTDKYKCTTTVGIKEKISCKKLSSSHANAEVIKEMTLVEPIERAWRPAETLQAYNTSLGSEAENVLPEVSHNTPVDCSSFANINEFNLCLNNIINYDDDDLIPEPLSPRVIILTDNSDHISSIRCSSHDSADNENQRLATRSEDQMQNIFDIVELSEDIELQRFRIGDQAQRQAFSIDHE